MEHNGISLGRIHKKNNDKKFFCHFTGFLEGIAASGLVEAGEYEPLIAECKEFVRLVADGDASDIIQDFELDLLEHESVQGAALIRIAEIDPNCTKSNTNRFLGFCRGIVCDGVVTTEEARVMVEYVDAHPDTMKLLGVREIYNTCSDAISDGIVDSEESSLICDAIGHMVGDCYADTGLSQPSGVANYSETHLKEEGKNLEGMVVVLTGTFKTSPRTILERGLADLGALITKFPSGKTDLIIVGGEASRDWLEMNRGTKIIKALELRANAERPFFVSESQIMKLLG